MLFFAALPNWLSWILTVIQAVIAIVLLRVFLKAKDKHGTLGQIGSILGIIVTIIGMYHTLPVTKLIFPFAPVEYHGSGYNEGFYYGLWNDGMPQGWGHLEYYNFSDGKTYSLNVDNHEYRPFIMKVCLTKGIGSVKALYFMRADTKTKELFMESGLRGRRCSKANAG